MMSDLNDKLWTKDFLINSIICFIINFAYYLTMVVITDYSLKKLHASLSEAGFACGIIILGVLVARLFIGKSIERIGTKKCLIAGLVIFVVGSIGNIWVTSLVPLYLIRLIQGLGFGASSTATAVIMAEIVPPYRKGEGTAYFSMFVTLATALGPFAGLFLYGNGNLFNNLIVGTVMLVIGVVLSLILVTPVVKLPEKPATEAPKRFSVSSLFEVNSLPLAYVTFFVSIGFAALLSFLSPYAQSKGLTVGSRFFFVAYAIFTVASRPFAGRLFDRKGENIVMLPAFVVFAAGLCVLGFAHSNLEVLLSGALVGIGFGTFMSTSQAIVITVAPPEHMGLANSTFFIFMDLGVGLGPLLLGQIIPTLKYSGMYEFMAIVMLVCLVAYYLVHGRKAAARQRAKELRTAHTAVSEA